MHRLIPGFLAMVFAFPLPSLAQGYRAPVGQEFARVAPGGTTILPNGRILTPLGDRLYTDGDLWNVVPSPDGKWIAGMCESGIVVCSSKEPAPRSPSFRIPWTQPAFCGVFTKDSSKLVTSSGDAGHGIQVFETREWSTPAKKRLEVRDLKPAGDDSRP